METLCLVTSLRFLPMAGGGSAVSFSGPDVPVARFGTNPRADFSAEHALLRAVKPRKRGGIMGVRTPLEDAQRADIRQLERDAGLKRLAVGEADAVLDAASEIRGRTDAERAAIRRLLLVGLTVTALGIGALALGRCLISDEVKVVPSASATSVVSAPVTSPVQSGVPPVPVPLPVLPPVPTPSTSTGLPNQTPPQVPTVASGKAVPHHVGPTEVPSGMTVPQPPTPKASETATPIPVVPPTPPAPKPSASIAPDLRGTF